MRMKLAHIARRSASARLASEEGFTLMVALGVMLVTSLLLAAAFEASRGDIQLSHRNTVQKQAYYAALAGIQEYEFHLQANPDYWETCAAPSKELQEQGAASITKSSCSPRAPRQKNSKNAAH